MEDSVKDLTPVPEKSGGKPSSKLLRYPLRSATKSKEEKPPAADSSKSSTPGRGRPASSVSKSVSVLDLSGKEKSAKPPRRLSVPAKSAASAVPKSSGNISPISEARTKGSARNQGKSETPVSDVSRSSNRRRFSVLSSASYWLSQIKLSESAAKHSISLGFFKLALEAGCEPLNRMRDELKSYARRQNLVELGEIVKELFEIYSITETFEQLQVSETCSHVPDEGTRSSDDDVYSTSSIPGTQKLKPKSLNTSTLDTSPVKKSAKQTPQTRNSVTRIRGLVNKSSANSKTATEVQVHNAHRKSHMSSKQESSKLKDKVKKQGKKSAHEEGPINTLPVEEALQDNKENMDARQTEEINSTEV
ncbi:unnamed protein product [Ilex paraguariensis]|uniref:Uncharacterized protein n=1 Tax=Ilex paraguariensis TaxID=185542 RepID=A0ABC8SEU6_9AQUA